jgi:ribosome-binding factor A
LKSEPKTGHRLERLQQIVREEITATLEDEVGDPTLSDVRVTNVSLSVDYRLARIHYVLPPPDDKAKRDAVAIALVRVSPFLRYRLSDAAEIKRVPDLKFIFEGHALCE